MAYSSRAEELSPYAQAITDDLQTLIKRISTHFGIPHQTEGICYGLAILATFAFLDKNPASWQNFLRRIQSLQKRLAVTYGTDYSASDETEPADKAFLVLLNLIQSPEKLSAYLGQLSLFSESQHTILTSWPIILKTAMESGILPSLQFSGLAQMLHAAAYPLEVFYLESIYSPRNLKTYFESLQTIINPDRFSITLVSMAHAVSILYQSPGQFIFINAGKGITPCKDVDELVQKVLAGFSCDEETPHLAIRSIGICVAEPGQAHPFRQLEPLDSWTMHTKTEDETGFHGNAGWARAQIAAANGESRVIRDYLSSPTNSPDRVFINGRGLLYLAAQYGHLNIAELLLHDGASTGQPLSPGDTLFNIANANGHQDIAAAIMKHTLQRTFHAIIRDLICDIQEYIDFNRAHSRGVCRSHGKDGFEAARTLMTRLQASPHETIDLNRMNIVEMQLHYQEKITALRAFAIESIPIESGTKEHSLRTYLTRFDRWAATIQAMAPGDKIPDIETISSPVTTLPFASTSHQVDEAIEKTV